MTTYRIHDRIKYQGSTGTLQHLNPDGSWRVWFDKKNWKGDRAQVDPFGVAKVDVKQEDLEEA